MDRRLGSGAGHLDHDAVPPRGEVEREVHERRQVGGEGPARVHDGAVHRERRRHRGAERDEVAAAARERRVRREEEDVAVAGLSVERDRAVGGRQRPRRALGEAEPPLHRLGEEPLVRRERAIEVEAPVEPEGTRERPGRDGAVLGPQARRGGVVAEHLRGGDARDAGAVRGEAGEARRERGERPLHLAGERGGALGELGEAPERDGDEGVRRRRRRERREVGGLGAGIEAAPGDERGGEAPPGLRGALRDRLLGASPRARGVVLEQAREGAAAGPARPAGGPGPGAARGEERRGERGGEGAGAGAVTGGPPGPAQARSGSGGRRRGRCPRRARGRPGSARRGRARSSA